MTKSSDNIAQKTLKRAEQRAQKTREAIRRNTLAYIGLHGVAYEQAQDRIAQIRSARGEVFESLVEKGEAIEKRAANLLSGAKHKAEDIVAEGSDKVWDMMPGATVNRIEELEAELAQARKKLAAMTKKTAKKAATKTKKTAAKAKTAGTAVKAAADDASEKAKAVAEKTVDAAKTVTSAVKDKTAKPAETSAKPAPTAKKEEPRHIPYFNDVKRYDPLASEDVVRKIVNHCGIALRSEDARYVACSDESERNTVRDSWLKKKLELAGSDADLDKKVLNVCSIMQRDNRKNRVTFYYLVAKAEKKLEAL